MASRIASWDWVSLPEAAHLVALESRRVGEVAVAGGDRATVGVVLKFFNTYLRTALNGRTIRAAYNVLNEYRQLAEAVVLQPAEAGQSAREPLDRRAIDRAIAALPPDQQAAVALFYLEEMSVAEVAVALDVPAGTVKTRLMHARRSLRETLQGEE